MKARTNLIHLLLVALLVVLDLAPAVVRADPPLAENPYCFPGIATSSPLSIATSSATVYGTLPSGYHGFLAKAVSADINYGDAGVSTGTSELYIPVGKVRWFGPFYKTSPLVYFRIRGTATTTSDLFTRGAPMVTNPAGAD